METTAIAPAMDHSHYLYSPLPSRPRLVWPGGARLALSILLYFEHWELDPSEQSFRDPRFKDINGYFFPDHFLYSLKDYGNRVGIFRVLDLLDRHKLKVTIAANAEACVRYPFLVDLFRKRGYEFAAHGLTATQMITGRMSVEDERLFIGESINTIERSTGIRPKGWISQDYGESTRTPELLAEAGLDYVVDWPNDEQPYAMTLQRPFVSIPNQAEWDDVQFLWHRRINGQRYATAVRAAADRLHADGEQTGRLLSIAIHPWVLGTPQRFRYLEQVVDHIVALPNLWSCSAHEIAQHVLSHPDPQRS